MGSDNIVVSDFRKLLAELPGAPKIHAFQLVVRREAMRDGLTVRLAAEVRSAEFHEQVGQHILEAFAARWPHTHADAVRGIIHPLEVEWVQSSELTTNPRTGKLLAVVDLRGGG